MGRTITEIWDQADHLVRTHGRKAPRLAAEQAHALLEAADIEGHLKWLRIMQAAKAKLERGPLPAAPLPQAEALAPRARVQGAER